jgi:hypothetical protein
LFSLNDCLKSRIQLGRYSARCGTLNLQPCFVLDIDSLANLTV